MNNNLENIINEIEILDFEKLDEIFKYKLSKEMVKIVYSFSRNICENCENCCFTCKFYCYFNCLRENSGRDVCNQAELNNLLRRFECNDRE